MYAGVQVGGPVGSIQTIQYATDLTQSSNWITLTNLTLLSSPQLFIDLDSATSPTRYYRAVQVPTQPTNPNPARLVWISPGTFTMGSPASEVDRNSNEGPQTQVTISHGFWMGTYPVTQGEYQSVTGSNPSYYNGQQTASWYWPDGSAVWGGALDFGIDTNRPVESVTWSAAVNYCSILTDSERSAGRLPAGYVYRLPTEAEWEYACRAGTSTRFSFGNDPTYSELPYYGWFDVNSTAQFPDVPDHVMVSFGATHPVGKKLPNPLGLYDINGNVYEWCADWYAASLPGGSVTDPVGPATDSGNGKIARGGSFAYGAKYCRSAYRTGAAANSIYYNFGLRVVLAPILH